MPCPNQDVDRETALRAARFRVREMSCVFVELPHKPGMLKRVTQALAADGIDIDSLYATATPDSARCRVVLSTSNDEHAIVAINR